MICSNEQINLKFNSYLLDFLKEKYNYDESPLLYSKKYSNGTFTITTPNANYKNCEFINGYPHFSIPFDVALKEIYNFLNDVPIYNNDFLIRYGDTHPHKIIPKLAQVRNIFIEDSISSMILTSGEKKSIYAIGNISLKTFEAMSQKINKKDSEEISDILVRHIFCHENIEEDIIKVWKEYSLSSKEKLIKFLSQNGFKINDFLLESTLYDNLDVYNSIINNILYEKGIRIDGSLRYILQELMFILSFSKDKQILFNIIGENQMHHVTEVLKVLKNNNIPDNVKFLTYGICKNADSRNIDEWSSYINQFIAKDLTFSNKSIKFNEFLKIIIVSLNNSNIMDYSKLDKYLKGIEMFRFISESRHKNTDEHNYINQSNDLINNMALVNYYLNVSIKNGEQSKFFRYLYSITQEYTSNLKKYSDFSNLYDEFVSKCLERLSLNEIENNKNNYLKNK